MDASPLRIVTYNVRYFGHMLKGLASTIGPKRRVAAALATLDPLPDVVCLQEVETSSIRSN
ncbi:MAG: endonuclease, partial [Myxococcaceae bacterium]